MRRRRAAFDDDTVEGYLAKVKESDARTTTIVQRPPYNCVSQMNNGFQMSNNYEPQLDLMQMINRCQSGRQVPVSNGDSSDFQTEENSTPTTETANNTNPTIISDEQEPLSYNPELPLMDSLVVKAMVVGTKEAKLHTFIHTLVPGGEMEECLPIKSPLDFVVKTDKSQEEKIVKYHFWLKECSRENEPEKFKSIYNTYYNIVSSYIFVYNVSDKGSFTALTRSIAEVKKTISKELNAILIGLANPNLPREVEFNEGKDMAVQEGFCEFVETDLSDGLLNQKILSFLANIAEKQQLKLKVVK